MNANKCEAANLFIFTLLDINEAPCNLAKCVSSIHEKPLNARPKKQSRQRHVTSRFLCLDGFRFLIPGKVLGHILLRRMRDHLLRHQRPEQSGFTPGKSTRDRILALRIIAECHRELGRGMLAAYIDLKKAFNTVYRESLGDPETEGNFNKNYWITATIQSHCGATLSNIKVTDLDFAGDVVICLWKPQWWLWMPPPSIEVKPFYLEVSWTYSTDWPGRGVMNSLNKGIWRCWYLCRSTNLRVFKALIMPVLLYGSETWTLSCALESRLDSFCNRSLRWIIGHCWRDYVSNQRLHRETGTRPVTWTIRDRQLRVYGHLTRFPQDDPAHQVVSVRDNPGWRRPRKLWIGQIDQTCREEHEMGRVPAWRLTMRNPRRWKKKRGCGYAPPSALAPR
ncbi:uncharacterized protein [Penaeus vannamei]|uniref:uncharacterized protein n=1 Tax=Penaeus vannamei TaxID=6689 RepID=UPI00387FA8CA